MAAQIMGKASVSTVTIEERNKAKVICLGELTIIAFDYTLGYVDTAALIYFFSLYYNCSSLSLLWIPIYPLSHAHAQPPL